MWKRSPTPRDLTSSMTVSGPWTSPSRPSASSVGSPARVAGEPIRWRPCRSARRAMRILRDAAALVEAGRLVPRLDSLRFTFDQAEAAHERVRSGAAQGKVVMEWAEYA
ncbi:hypothetical protein G6F46_015400 [Rhizopus delemar]|nr:hypothetical protein G6F46_015400 [Rhizopus delemar]